MQTAVRHFKVTGRGHVINVSSLLGRLPYVSFRAAYRRAEPALLDKMPPNACSLLASNMPPHLSLQRPSCRLQCSAAAGCLPRAYFALRAAICCFLVQRCKPCRVADTSCVGCPWQRLQGGGEQPDVQCPSGPSERGLLRCGCLALHTRRLDAPAQHTPPHTPAQAHAALLARRARGSSRRGGMRLTGSAIRVACVHQR